jgi:hypothetical protein
MPCESRRRAPALHGATIGRLRACGAFPGRDCVAAACGLTSMRLHHSCSHETGACGRTGEAHLIPLMLANSSSASSRGSSPCCSSLAEPRLSAGPGRPGRAGSALRRAAAAGPAPAPALGHLAAGQLLERGRVELPQRVQLRAHPPAGISCGSGGVHAPAGVSRGCGAARRRRASGARLVRRGLGLAGHVVDFALALHNGLALLLLRPLGRLAGLVSLAAALGRRRALRSILLPCLRGKVRLRLSATRAAWAGPAQLGADLGCRLGRRLGRLGRGACTMTEMFIALQSKRESRAQAQRPPFFSRAPSGSSSLLSSPPPTGMGLLSGPAAAPGPMPSLGAGPGLAPLTVYHNRRRVWAVQ